jgi:hypothetical protein
MVAEMRRELSPGQLCVRRVVNAKWKKYHDCFFHSARQRFQNNFFSFHSIEGAVAYTQHTTHNTRSHTPLPRHPSHASPAMPVGVLGLANATWLWLQTTLPPVWITMLKIFTSMFLGVYLLSLTLSRAVVSGGSKGKGKSKKDDEVVYAEGQWFTSKKGRGLVVRFSLTLALRVKTRFSC